MVKGNAHITNEAESAQKRANLAAANAAATAKVKKSGAAQGGKNAAGKGGKQKPTEEEIMSFAQDLDKSMIDKAQTSFRRGLIASVAVVIIVVGIILVAKAFLGVGV